MGAASKNFAALAFAIGLAAFVQTLTVSVEDQSVCTGECLEEGH